jgi:predicted nucleic acid-binding protein
MSDKFFLDTNIFIYTFDSREPGKQQKADELVSNALNTGNGIISFQVIQEFFSAATRKFISPLSASDCQKYLNNVLAPLCKVTYESEISVTDRHSSYPDNRRCFRDYRRSS